MQALLLGLPVEVCALSDCRPVDFPDEGIDYKANAIAKARAVCDQIGEWAIADDSGLEVEALGGAPGPLSARYGGAGLDDSGRVSHLLAALVQSKVGGRGARFVCHAALCTPEGRVETAEGICSGVLLESPSGTGGFGYDPIFVPTGYDRSMAELPAALKDEISHRGRALAKLAPLIEAWALEPGAADPSQSWVDSRKGGP